MKIRKSYTVTAVEYETFTYTEELWLEFKDTIRDEFATEMHDEDIRVEWQDEFIDWLVETGNTEYEMYKDVIDSELIDTEWERV